MNWRFLIAWVVAGIFLGGGLLRADDSYIHTFTGFTFPPTVGSFEKKRVTPFNEAHSDIEVDYDNKPFTVHLSFYVYPANGPLKPHYEKCKSDVVQVHHDAKLLKEEPVTLEKSGVKYDGFSALYSFRGNFFGTPDQELLSKVIVFKRGDYYVLVRVTYALSDKTNAELEIADFIYKLEWPAGDGSAEK